MSSTLLVEAPQDRFLLTSLVTNLQSKIALLVSMLTFKILCCWEFKKNSQDGFSFLGAPLALSWNLPLEPSHCLFLYTYLQVAHLPQAGGGWS